MKLSMIDKMNDKMKEIEQAADTAEVISRVNYTTISSGNVKNSEYTQKYIVDNDKTSLDDLDW